MKECALVLYDWRAARHYLSAGWTRATLPGLSFIHNRHANTKCLLCRCPKPWANVMPWRPEFIMPANQHCWVTLWCLARIDLCAALVLLRCRAPCGYSHYRSRYTGVCPGSNEFDPATAPHQLLYFSRSFFLWPMIRKSALSSQKQTCNRASN
jgi:hypothetical protein